MMKGEPLTLGLIINGLLWFLVVQIFGVLYTGVFGTVVNNVAQLHFLAVFLGWIGFVILGAELQMSRAFTALRRFEPEILRWLLPIFLNSGLIIALIGTALRMQILVILGLVIYLIGVLIHTYWVVQQRRSPLFKFPLGYHLLAQFFYIVGLLVLLLNSLIGFYGIIQERTNVAIVFTIGWIGLVLTGTMIRILPMFLGKVINRGMKNYLWLHLLLAITSSILLMAGLLMYSSYFIVTPILWIGATLWGLMWIFTLVILFVSLSSKRKTLNKVTLFYFVPGIVSFSIGLLFGMAYLTGYGNITVIRRLHIHLTLLAGLSMIMLGASHRITSFQIHSIIYSGRKTEAPPISFLLMDKGYMVLAITLVISQLVLIVGVIMGNSIVFGIGGLLHLLASTVFIGGILKNYRFYLREKDNAIPFDRKGSEV